MRAPSRIRQAVSIRLHHPCIFLVSVRARPHTSLNLEELR